MAYTLKRITSAMAVSQGRFKGILVQKDSHLPEVCRYVVLNPVRAKTISHPWLYKWSSYRATVYGPSSSLSYVRRNSQSLRHRKPVTKQKYREFVQDGIGSSSIWDKLEPRACWESKALPMACAILSSRSSRSEDTEGTKIRRTPDFKEAIWTEKPW
jgi:hypothetical protein